MVEFNADGSIKLPGYLEKKKSLDSTKMKLTRCIQIKKDVVSTNTPKSCELIITLSEAIKDDRFITNIFSEYSKQSQVPMKIVKESDKKFKITVGSDFRRCTTCNTLIGRYREFLDGNIIIENGRCTFETKRPSFSYEDYFD